MQRKGNGAQWSKFSSRRTKKKTKNYSHVDCVLIETQIPISKKKKKLCINRNKYSKKKKSTIIRIIIKNHKKFRRKNKNPSREREREYSQLFCEKNMDYIEEMTPNLYKIK